MVYKLLPCSPNTLSGLIRRFTDRTCGVISIKQRKRYLHADLSSVGQCKLKDKCKEAKEKQMD